MHATKLLSVPRWLLLRFETETEERAFREQLQPRIALRMRRCHTVGVILQVVLLVHSFVVDAKPLAELSAGGSLVLAEVVLQLSLLAASCAGRGRNVNWEASSVALTALSCAAWFWLDTSPSRIGDGPGQVRLQASSAGGELDGVVRASIMAAACRCTVPTRVILWPIVVVSSVVSCALASSIPGPPSVDGLAVRCLYLCVLLILPMVSARRLEKSEREQWMSERGAAGGASRGTAAKQAGDSYDMTFHLSRNGLLLGTKASVHGAFFGRSPESMPLTYFLPIADKACLAELLDTVARTGLPGVRALTLKLPQGPMLANVSVELSLGEVGRYFVGVEVLQDTAVVNMPVAAAPAIEADFSPLLPGAVQPQDGKPTSLSEEHVVVVADSEVVEFSAPPSDVLAAAAAANPELSAVARQLGGAATAAATTGAQADSGSSSSNMGAADSSSVGAAAANSSSGGGVADDADRESQGTLELGWTSERMRLLQSSRSSRSTRALPDYVGHEFDGRWRVVREDGREVSAWLERVCIVKGLALLGDGKREQLKTFGPHGPILLCGGAIHLRRDGRLERTGKRGDRSFFERVEADPAIEEEEDESVESDDSLESFVDPGCSTNALASL